MKNHTGVKKRNTQNIKDMSENSEEQENGKWICTMYEEGKIIY